MFQLTVRAVLRGELRFERLDRARLADTARIEVREQGRLGVAGDHDQRVAVERRRARQRPRLGVGQVVFGGVLDERAAHVHVDVRDVDEPRTRSVAGLGQFAHERRVVEERVDEERLAGLDVRADADDQVGIGAEVLHPRRE